MYLSPMTITISNESASVFARGYAHTENGLIVWLEIAPQHPKLTGVIWATLVNGHRAYLQLKNTDKGLGRAYTHLETDAPTLAVANDGGKATAARAKLARLGRGLLGLLVVIYFISLTGMFSAFATENAFLYGNAVAYIVGNFLAIPVAILAVGAVVFTFLAWRRDYWSLAWRIHYTLVTLGAMGVVWWYLNWKVIG